MERRLTLKDFESHRRMNLPNSIIRQSLSPVRSIFRCVADVPKCFFRTLYVRWGSTDSKLLHTTTATWY